MIDILADLGMRYHFHIRDGAAGPDLDGSELPSREAAKREALLVAGEMIRDVALEGRIPPMWNMEVADEAGEIICRLAFSVDED